MTRICNVSLSLIMFLFCFSNLTFADYDTIVDNDTLNFKTVGSWASSTTVAGYYGSNYRWAYGGSGSATTEWNFQLPVPGMYQVLAWWPGTYSTRSPNAPYAIYHAGGSTTVTADQRINGSQWNDLGTFQFSSGTARVVLSNAAANNPVADAVRMVLIEGSQVVSADFSASPLSGLSPLQVTFTDTSFGPVQTWSWDFGDGQTSTEQSPVHEYLATGKYTVSLTVSGSNGTDTKIKANYISVQDQNAFEAIIDNDTAGFKTTGTWYSSTTVAGYYGTNYQWVYGGSGSSTAEWGFQLPAAGMYQVLAWWPGTYSTRSPNAPYTIYYSSGSTTKTVDQRTNGGQWNDLGTYFFAAGQGRVVLSNAASGNPIADAVRIISTQGSQVVAADFSASPLSGYSPLEITFSDKSTGPVQTWSWDFGDGQTSTEQNPIHTYGSPGKYTVSLTVTGPGNPDTKSKIDYITVNNRNTTAFEFIWPIDENDFFIFQAFGNNRFEEGYHSGTDFGVYSYNVPVLCIANGWVEKFNPGDDGDGNGIMIKHVLPDQTTVYSWYNHLLSLTPGLQIGEFIPQGTILGITGETGWAPSGIHLHLEIKKYNDFDGGYIYDLSKHYNAYEFIRSRLIYNTYPPSECDDGTSINQCSATKPLHCIPGGYLVMNSILCGCDAGVSNTDGTCTESDDGIIIDNHDPEFQYTGNWRSSTNVMGFYGSDYLIADAGSANTSATCTPNIPEEGYYKVFGWWREAFTTNQSYRSKNALITITTGLKQHFATADFSDYHTGWKYIGTYLFEQGTNNSIIVSSVPDGDVVADAFRFVWDAAPVPRADFTAMPADGMIPLTVSFTDKSMGDVSSWSWDFGDGQTSTEQNPTHQYLSAGKYTVALQIIGPHGTDTKVKTDYIKITGFDSIVDNDSAEFKTVGTWYSSTAVPGFYGSNYRWAYGGSGSATAEWSFQLPAAGTYQVLAWWPGTYSTRSPSAPYTIYYSGGNMTRKVDQRVNGGQWNDLGTYFFAAGQARVVLSNAASGNPIADAVRVVSTQGSQVVVADFSASMISGLSPLQVTFIDTSFGPVQAWSWDFGDGQTSTEQHPTHEYLSPGKYTVTLMVSGPNSTDTKSKPDYISVQSQNAFEAIIDNDSAGFKTTGTWYSSTAVPGFYGANYRWAYGGSGSATAEWSFQLPGAGTYQVLAWWPGTYSTRSPNAPYTIYHNGESTTKTVDQRINGGQWNDLGTYFFSAEQARVVLTNAASGNPIADAVKIIYLHD